MTFPATGRQWREWRTDHDGMLVRDAARVILLDADDRVLLVRGHDVDQPERSWWFTIGGGIDAGETAAQAAARELAEECGILLAPEDLLGPVGSRTAEFDFYSRTVRQHETFFLHRLRDHAPEAADSGWTETEHEMLDELRWWDLGELALVGIEVFPTRLVPIVRTLISELDTTGRWRGRPRRIGR